jgi:hypothetical protein
MESFSTSCETINGEEFERCRDGYCRPKGSCKCVQVSGCQFGKHQCPDGRCVYSLNLCAGYGKCGVMKPWYCGGGFCEAYHTECADRISHASFLRKTLQYAGINDDGTLDTTLNKNQIYTISFKNYFNGKMSGVSRTTQEIFSPSEIGPYYNIDPVKSLPVWSLEQYEKMKKPKRILASSKKSNQRNLQTVTPASQETSSNYKP